MAKNTGESKAITTRAADFSQWYLDVIEAAQLAENSVVRGSMFTFTLPIESGETAPVSAEPAVAGKK